MKKYDISVNSDDEQKGNTEIRDLAYILFRLRKATKIWKIQYGYFNRVEMKKWEDKADEWISNNISFKEP